jgi:hypothetical protein
MLNKWNKALLLINNLEKRVRYLAERERFLEKCNKTLQIQNDQLRATRVEHLTIRQVDRVQEWARESIARDHR